MSALLRDAIQYAHSGAVVADRVAYDWASCEPWLKTYPDAAEVLLPSGRAPKAGQVFRNPALARTLGLIAEEGRQGFYHGEVARDLVDKLRSEGGLHTLEDFAAASGEYVEPIHTSYRGYELYQVPPNNQGLTALMMLNTLGGFDLADMGATSASRYHLEIEAARLAYSERDRRIGDPEHARVPVDHLLSSEYTAHLRRQINPNRASTELAIPVAEHSDTVYLSVVDKDRNAVSFIFSLYNEFGSGIMGPRSGVLLQNRGKSFRLDPLHPNCIAPKKRPMHTIMPGMLMKDGRVQASLGVMGGDYQPTGQVHVLTNIIDFNMDPQEAMDSSRVLYQKGKVEVEQGISRAIREELEARGHELVEVEAPLGGGQIIWVDHERGTLTGGSDPRKDGCALGY
jgi:gamma-glutamyltranspeptidase/glutathione hydrolase